MTIISVTGHRHISHDFDKVVECLEKVFEQIKPTKVITGMAVGFDQLVAYTCIKNGIPFEAAIPCDNQDKLWPETAKAGYQELLTQAAKVTKVNTGPYAAWKMHSRNGYLVKNCDILLAYLDPGTTEGGTLACTKLAVQSDKKIVNLFEMTEVLIRLHQESGKNS